ncbi:MAG: A/G-specific adenine glycosylase [Candidatus Sumerlaeia bacterium]|nr:A/G-specific adenine glycosylase [Candidatus Sumerlaeia bacterium]
MRQRNIRLPAALAGRIHRAKHRLQRALLAWFRRHARDLPWRRTCDPYRVWLSEIMLQQTRVDTVIPYYRRFLKAFPTVRALAAAPFECVLKLWEGLGYYSRARNLHRAAQMIAGERNGVFPQSAAEWQHLPGVGRYTAAAVASIAFGECAAVLDGNVRRVLIRLFALDRPRATARQTALLWAIAETLVPHKRAGDFNQAIMELGARVCTPRNPRCDVCPVRGHCEARKLGRQTQLPVRQARKALPHYDIVAAAIRRRGRYLLGRRRPDEMLGGLWEFPGGKVERGETHEQALRREIREELGIEVAVGRHVASVRHAYSHFAITLHVYQCTLVGGRPAPRRHTALAWVAPSEFDRYAFPGADRKFLHLL